MVDVDVTRRVVTEFLAYVRSGRDPSRARSFMAPRVRAHQVQSEEPLTIVRTPAEYADHVREMVDTWGDFQLEVEDLLVDGPRAYVRLTQTGRHAATGRVARQTNAIVYHVENGLITEYWMQIDRAGLTAQLGNGPHPN
jgi:predicted ester cyclase